MPNYVKLPSMPPVELTLTEYNEHVLRQIYGSLGVPSRLVFDPLTEALELAARSFFRDIGNVRTLKRRSVFSG